MSRIIFLGTAGSSAVANRRLRASGGIVLQLEGLQFHLDPGPGAINEAMVHGINPHHTTAVLVSHNHLNHCNDLNVVIDAMTHGGIETRGLVIGAKSVLQDTDEGHSFLTKYHKKLVEKVISVEKKHKVGIELVEINSVTVDHTDPFAVGFKFFCPKFTLAYSGDTALTDKFLEELTGVDILILNVPYPGDTGKNKNLDTQAAIKIVSYVRPELVILTHFGLEMLKADPIQEAREVQRITGVQCVAAKDGLVISPGGFGKYKGPIKGYQ